MPSLPQELYDVITSVDASPTVLSVSDEASQWVHVPQPGVDIRGVGELPLPLTETRARAVLHPTMAPTLAHVATNKSNLTEFDASHVSVNASFNYAVQDVAEHHCKLLGVRDTFKKRTSTEHRHSAPRTYTPLVEATLRSLVVVWPSDSQCVIPDVHKDSQKGENNNNDSNSFGCLLLQLPAKYRGGKVSIQNTSDGGKEETHDMSTYSHDRFQATSFYTDAVSHSIAPVSTGVMLFLMYDLRPTEACKHIPSPTNYARLTAKMTQLANQWALDKSSSDMYAFALHHESHYNHDVFPKMLADDLSRVDFLEDCKNLAVFIVSMAKQVRGWSEHYDRDCGIASEINEVVSIHIKAKWYALNKKLLHTDDVLNEIFFKDRHMLGHRSLFRRHPDTSSTGQNNLTQQDFYGTVIVLCPRERVARMALSLSFETATNFVEQGLCTHADLLTAFGEYNGPRRGSSTSWLEMTKKALLHKQKDQIVSLLKLLNNWQKPSCDNRPDNDERYEEEGEGEERSTRIFAAENMVKTVAKIATVYASDEAVVSSIAQLGHDLHKRDIKRCIELVETLIQMPSSSSSSSSTQPCSPCHTVSDRLASACLRRVMSVNDIAENVVTRTLNMALQNASMLPSTFALRYDLVTNLVSRPHLNSYLEEHPACAVLPHVAVQADFNLAKTAVCSTKLDQYDDPLSVVNALYALLETYRWARLGESMLQCCEHSSISCLAVSLKMANTNMQKYAAVLATKALRHLPANALSPGTFSRHSLTLGAICRFVAQRYLNGDVLWNSTNPSLWETLEKWLLEECDTEQGVIKALRAVVRAGFKQGTLSLLRRMSGVTSSEIVASMCDAIDKFGWIDLQEAILKFVRNTSASSLQWTLSLESHFNAQPGTLNNNISIAFEKCIVQSMCEVAGSLELAQVKEVGRLAFRSADDGYQAAKQFISAVFATEQCAVTMPVLLQLAIEYRRADVAVHVLSFFDKPMSTGKSVSMQDIDSDEIVTSTESVCGLFNDGVVDQVWAVLQANGLQNAELNQVITSIVHNTSVTCVDRCGKLALLVWAASSTTSTTTAVKWQSEQAGRAVVHDILDSSIRNFRSVKSNGRDCKQLLAACLQVEDHKLYELLVDRVNEFNVNCTGIVILHDFNILNSDAPTQDAQVLVQVQERITSSIQHLFDVLVSSATEQASVNVQQVVDIASNAATHNISNSIETIVSGVIDLNAVHAGHRKKAVLSKLLEDSTIRCVFGPTRMARLAQSLKVYIAQDFDRAKQDFPIALHLPSHCDVGIDKGVFSEVRMFLESSSINRLTTTVRNVFRGIGQARDFENVLQAMIVNRGRGIGISSTASGVGMKAHVTIFKTGPNIEKLQRVHKVNRAELAKLLPIINASNVP